MITISSLTSAAFVAFFLNKLIFGITLNLQKSCRSIIESSHIPFTQFPLKLNILHNDATFVKQVINTGTLIPVFI